MWSATSFMGFVPSDPGGPRNQLSLRQKQRKDNQLLILSFQFNNLHQDDASAALRNQILNCQSMEDCDVSSSI